MSVDKYGENSLGGGGGGTSNSDKLHTFLILILQSPQHTSALQRLVSLIWKSSHADALRTTTA